MDQQQQQMSAPPVGLGQPMNLEVMKEPRGFMKVLQFIFSICAFATVTGFETYIAVTTNCLSDGKQKEKQLIQYPFNMDGKTMPVCDDEIRFYGSVSSDARFFVATGVLSFLYSAAACAFYVLMDKMYQNNSLVPVTDFLMTVVLSLFWLAGSSAWANGLGTLKNIVDPKTVMGYNDNDSVCSKYDCVAQFSGNFAGLNVSVILGFLNLILWGSNLWFLYKETAWFRGQGPPPEVMPSQQTYPPFPQQA